MLASLIAALASGEIFGAVRRARGAAIAYLLAMTFGIVGVGFLVGGGFVLASRRWGPVEAALGFGLGFIVLAGLVLIVHSILRRVRSRSISKQRGVEMGTIAGAAAVSLLPVLMRGKVGFGGIMGPLIAVAAYAIYRENQSRKPDGDSDKT